MITGLHFWNIFYFGVSICEIYRQTPALVQRAKGLPPGRQNQLRALPGQQNVPRGPTSWNSTLMIEQSRFSAPNLGQAHAGHSGCRHLFVTPHPMQFGMLGVFRLSRTEEQTC